MKNVSSSRGPRPRLRSLRALGAFHRSLSALRSTLLTVFVAHALAMSAEAQSSRPAVAADRPFQARTGVVGTHTEVSAMRQTWKRLPILPAASLIGTQDFAAAGSTSAADPRPQTKRPPTRPPVRSLVVESGPPEVDPELFIVSRGCGFACDVQRHEGRLRRFTDANRAWLAPTLGGLAFVSQGMLHGAFYGKGNKERDMPLDKEDVHAASWLHAGTVWTLAYVAGADPVDALGSAVIASFFFQGLLNLGISGTFFDENESSCWDTYGGLCVPKMFTGRNSYADLAIGTAIIVVPRIIRRIR